jgi:hypothetical protein
VRQVEAAAAEWPGRLARDEAYRRLASACAAGDAAQMFRSAEAFLAARPLTGTDPRHNQAVDLRNQGREMLLRKRRDEAYDRLRQAMRTVVTASDKEDLTALEACDSFLQTLAVGSDTDPRQDQVRQLRGVTLAAPKRRIRDAAYGRLIEAARLGKDGEPVVAEQARLFREALPAGEEDPRAGQVNRLRDLAREGPNRRQRTAAYRRLLDAWKRKDETTVLVAAAAFAAARPVRLSDPRAEHVRQIVEAAREWPDERVRDLACARLRKGGSDREMMAAAELFLETPPLRGVDPRTDLVLRSYRAAFTRWFTDRPEGPDVRERIGKYTTLVVNR